MIVSNRYALCFILFFTTLYGSDRKRRFEPLPDQNYVLAQALATQVYGLVSADPALLVFSYLGEGKTIMDLKEAWKKAPVQTPDAILNFGVCKISGYEHMIALSARFLKHSAATYNLYVEQGTFLYNSQNDTVTTPENLTRYPGRDHGPRQLLMHTLPPVTTWSPSNVRTTIKPIASMHNVRSPQIYSSFWVERFPETLIAQAARAHEESRHTEKLAKMAQIKK